MTDELFRHEYSRDQKIDAIKKEISMRHLVYGRRVDEGKMTRRSADNGIAVFEAILADYEAGVIK